MALLADKITLVTGGSSGIGLATVERFRAEGAHVILADVDPRGADLAAERGAEFLSLDVGDPSAWEDGVAGIVERHGGLDVAFLNAGVMTRPATDAGIERIDVSSLALDDYRREMAVNVDGLVFGIRAVLPALRARGGGAIVATASIAGLMPYQTDPIYAGTKHFVIGVVRSMARVLAKEAITINAVCPAGVATKIVGPSLQSRADAEAAGLPLMDPAQIADAVCHAIADGSSGRAWMCQLDRPHEQFVFSQVPGIG